MEKIINWVFWISIVLFSCCIKAEQLKYNDISLIKDSANNESEKMSVKVMESRNAPTRITRKIRQDKEDNLLFASFEDVITFDGNSFSKLKKGISIESFDAFDALEDSKGNIWIASTQQGVYLYDGKNYSNFSLKDGLGSNRAMTIYEDTAGRIWIATQGGLSFHDRNMLPGAKAHFQNFTTKDGLTSNDINTIFEDRTGILWVGTRGSLNVKETSVYSTTEVTSFQEIKDNQGKPFNNVWSVIEDQKGNIWFSDSGGLWRHKNNGFTHISTLPKSAVLYEDKKGDIWFTQKEGLYKYEHKALQSENPRPIKVHTSDGMLFGIMEDKNGNIWVGTLKGVFRYDGQSVEYFRNVASDNK